jgi:hypothetical protein
MDRFNTIEALVAAEQNSGQPKFPGWHRSRPEEAYVQEMIYEWQEARG